MLSHSRNVYAMSMIACISFCCVIGCGGSGETSVALDSSSSESAGTTSSTTTVTAPPAPAAPPPPAPIAPIVPATKPAEESQPEEPAMDREKAQAGVGKKGRGYGGGVISEPVRAYFRTGQNIIFQIKIPDALRKYEAMNDGKGPASHEEFMEKIIEPNSIELPELPEGDSYFFDAEKQELLVQRPE